MCLSGFNLKYTLAEVIPRTDGVPFDIPILLKKPYLVSCFVKTLSIKGSDQTFTPVNDGPIQCTEETTSHCRVKEDCGSFGRSDERR